MLAKPEYFSPPDEVCCWPGRCGGAVAGLGAVAENYRESAAGLGAVAELLPAGGAVAKLLQAGNRWHRGQPAGAVKRNSIGKSLPLRERRCGCIGKPTNAHKREGPGRDLNISPEPLLFIALRKGNTPGAVAVAIMQGLQGRLQQMQELRRALGIRQG